MLRDYYRKVLNVYGYGHERPFITEVIEIIERGWEDKRLFVVEAPTGYGKSTITATIALRAYDQGGKIIIALPMRTLLEDQFSKLRMLIRDDDVIGKRYMYEHTSPYLMKPITLTTVDTLSLTMFGLAPEDIGKVVKGWDEWTGTLQGTSGHYLFSWSSVLLSDIVLDEAHLLSDETKSLTYMIALLKYVVENNQHIILMSATLPSALKKVIDTHLHNYKDRIEWISFEGKDDAFLHERQRKIIKRIIRKVAGNNKFNEIKELVDQGINEGLNRILVIFNTVRDAVNFYSKLDGYKNRLLLHSRFTLADKQKKHEILQKFREKPEEGYIIVGTQSVEAGVDASSTLLITELAPLNSLIQRFGRFLRYDEEIGKAYIWYEGDTSEWKSQYKNVYDAELCRKSLYLLERHSDINLHTPYGPGGYKKLIDELYQEIKPPNKGDIEKMLTVFLNFEKISNAVELFFQFEGSFIRDKLMMPVKTADLQEPIPINFSLFKRMLNNGKVKSLVTEHSYIPLDDNLRKKFMNERSAFRNLYKHDVKAFLVDAHYTSESGLLTEEDSYD